MSQPPPKMTPESAILDALAEIVAERNMLREQLEQARAELERFKMALVAHGRHEPSCAGRMPEDVTLLVMAGARAAPVCDCVIAEAAGRKHVRKLP